MKHRRNKFGAVKTPYNGVTYDSKAEAKQAMELDWRVRASELTSWKRQVPIELDYFGVKITDYIIDFVAQRIDGRFEFIEVKGHPTPEWIIKWRMFLVKMAVENPEAVIMLVSKNPAALRHAPEEMRRAG